MNLKEADELTLIIKKYNKPRAFSNYIHSNIHNNFSIEGSFVRLKILYYLEN